MNLDLEKYGIKSLDDLRIEISRRRCEESFAEFVKQAWHVLEPSTPLVWGKVMDVLCETLENFYFTDTFQPRLLINVPPGLSKSLLTSVFLPAWIWTFAPSTTFTGVSHEQGLAIRDSRKMRLLITSEWYQARWPIEMSSDADAKTNFENTKRGFRQAVPFRSMTGRRSDFVIVDDPHSAEDANSDAYRAEVKRIFRETLPSRVNNDESRIVVIMQRLHEEDVSGIILSEEDRFGYQTVILPMRYDATRPDPLDWRMEEGELLFPERFSEEAVTKLEKMLGEYATAGQLQQRPVPRDGGLFKREWFQFETLMPNDVSWVRGYDLAASTKKKADFTASTRLGITNDGRVIIANVQNEKLSPAGVKGLVKSNAEVDGKSVRISIAIDPGQAGLAQADSFRADLMGYDCRFSPETGDKQSRAMGLAAQAEGGKVYLMKGDWNENFLDQICNFPAAKHDDMVDSATRAFNECVKMIRQQPKSAVSLFGAKAV